MLPYRSLTEPFQPDAYLKNWETVEQKVAQRGFTWATLYENDEDNQYMSDSLLLIPEAMKREIDNATRAVHAIYRKTYQEILKEPAIIHQLGLPVMMWDVALMADRTNYSYFSRIDFIASANGLKLIEVNTDTPVGIVEAAIAQDILCNEHKAYNPNEQLAQKIKDTWNAIIRDYDIRSSDTLYFTAADWHEEDKQTIHYLLNLYPQQARYLPLEEIVVEEDGVKTPEGKVIKFLYRLYPLEYFLEEKSGTGEAIGEQFLGHIAHRKVNVINPPSALLMQSKAILALITEKKEEWFTSTEQAAIEQYFLPSYFSASSLHSYVKKPVLGREGGGIQIVSNRQIIAEDNDYYQEQQTIYQDYFPMPEQTIDTWDGPYTGKLLIGSHVFNGEPSGLFLRVGELITGNLSLFVPYTTTR